MYSGILGFYMAHIAWMAPLTVLIVLGAFMLWVKYSNDLLWTDFWVVVPLVGKMRRWVQDTHGIGDRASWESEGMPRPESQLCATYLDRKRSPTAGAEDFERAKEYLKLTHQSDITPTSAWMWTLLIILTVAEAAGTGLLIAPYVASEITGNQMLWIGYVIALVMAAGLLGLTHFAGAQAHKYSTIRNHIGNVGRAHDDLLTAAVTCGDDQSVDAELPGKDLAQVAKIRFANRVLEGAHDRGTLAWVFVVLVVLVSLLSGVTWMRIEGLRTQLTQATVEQAQNSSASNPFANIPGMPGVSAVPQAVDRSASDAKQHAQAELTSEQFSQGIAGAVVLALIYLITQGLGFLHALKHSFVGSGRRAYGLTRGESSYTTYESKYIMPVINTAQKRLEFLRARLSENTEYRKRPSTMSCHDYFIRQQQRRDGMNLPPVSPPSAYEQAEADAAEVCADAHLMAEARKILDEPDAEMRRRLLDFVAGSSTEKRTRLLHAIKQVKDERERQEEQERERDALAKLEDDLLGD